MKNSHVHPVFQGIFKDLGIQKESGLTDEYEETATAELRKQLGEWQTADNAAIFAEDSVLARKHIAAIESELHRREPTPICNACEVREEGAPLCPDCQHDRDQHEDQHETEPKRKCVACGVMFPIPEGAGEHARRYWTKCVICAWTT